MLRFICLLSVATILLFSTTARGQTPTDVATDAARAPSTDRLPSCVATRQNNFRIPFQIGAAERSEQQPVKVELYVSADQGKNWEWCATAKPEERAFTFHAAADGEYWFCVRTIDRSGTIRPQGPYRCEMRVLVDATPPQLELTVSTGPAGEVVTLWRAEDPYLVRDSFTLEYQLRSDLPWQKIAVSPPPPGEEPLWQGESTWLPETVAEQITIRARIRDKAGNETVVNRQMTVPHVADWSHNPDGGWTASSRPIRSPDPPAPAAAPEPDHLAGRNRVTWEAYETARAPAADDTNLSAWVPRRADTRIAERPAERPGYQTASSGGYYGSRPEGSADAPTGFVPLAGPHRLPATEVSASIGIDNPPEEKTPGNTAENASRENSQNSPATTADLPTPSLDSIPEQAQQMTTRRFRLDYQLDAASPEEVTKVELWLTADRGRTWSLYGLDDDRQSPFSVELPADGLFGFRIIVRDVYGLSGKMPQGGDQPDLWVAVDTTAPTVRLTSVRYGQGENRGKLEVFWKAEDRWFSDRPVALSYAADPKGPWTTLAHDQPADGRYVWSIDGRQVPQQVYVRAEAVDRFGNRNEEIAPQPVDLRGLVPRARIEAVQPVSEPRYPQTGKPSFSPGAEADDPGAT